MKRINPSLSRDVLSLEVEVDDDSIVSMTLYSKNSKEAVYHTVVMGKSKGNTFKAVLRGKDVRKDMDYYIEGISRSGLVSSAGDPTHPLKFRARAKSPSDDVEAPVSF